jgi:hypothetical protein
MRLIVSDTSCLIDLRKASLLEALIRLPYEIGIPDVLFEELVRFESLEVYSSPLGALVLSKKY